MLTIGMKYELETTMNDIKKLEMVLRDQDGAIHELRNRVLPETRELFEAQMSKFGEVANDIHVSIENLPVEFNRWSEDIVRERERQRIEFQRQWETKLRDQVSQKVQLAERNYMDRVSAFVNIIQYFFKVCVFYVL